MGAALKVAAPMLARLRPCLKHPIQAGRGRRGSLRHPPDAICQPVKENRVRPDRREGVVGTFDEIDRQLVLALQGWKRASALNAQEVEARVAGGKHEVHGDPSAGDALKIVPPRSSGSGRFTNRAASRYRRATRATP